MADQETVTKCLGHVRELPFIEQVELAAPPEIGPRHRPDLHLQIRTPRGNWPFRVEVKTAHLTYALAEDLALRAREHPDLPIMVFARYLPRDLAKLLADRDLCFIDAMGNCHVALDRDYVAHVEGRTPPPGRERESGMGIAGYKLLFAMLAEPRLLELPARDLAREVGVGKPAVAQALERLEKEGILNGDPTRRQILPGLDAWFVGFESLVRPRLKIGTFRTPDRHPEALERRVEKSLGKKIDWAWGGGAAAMRLTGHYRGENTVLYVDQPPENLQRRLRATADREGPLTILRPPGKIALQGAMPRTVHPLLVYTELIGDRDERAREAAVQLREKFLRDL